MLPIAKKSKKGSSYAPVRYIPGLKRRLISARQLDEEGYHVGFRDHQWKVTNGSLVRLGDISGIGMHMLASKGHVLDVRKADIYFCKPSGMGKQKNLSFIMLEKTRKLQRVAYSRGGMAMKGYKSHTLEDLSSLTKPIQKSQVVLVDIPKNLAENESIVAEHGLSSEITQSPSGSSDMNEGSKNSRNFEDSGRSNEEYSKDGESSKDGGSETPHVRRSNKESRAPVRYSPSANYLQLTENGKPESYSEALSSKESVQWKKDIIEEMVSLEKNQMCTLVRISAGKKSSQRLWMFKVKEERNGRKPRLHIEGNDVQTDSSTEAMKTKVDDMLVAGFDMAEFNKPK
nr:retrovirus-related Pol polyprotein from transposon TNT 1-94 [Tanacetum cinerariifolium]